MKYPSFEQYAEALQAPEIVFIDPELKKGSVETTGLGLPLALCGGFALTYTITSGEKKYAVRCFHKPSNALEKRYSAISSRLKSLKSSYFVDFKFQPTGIRVGGNVFPIVKMIWTTGTTLGEYLELNYRNATVLQNLVQSFRTLAKYLEGQKMAHGDIQPGNVMVADDGRKVQLIDYDGIYVEELYTLGSAELGHRNFQHPGRTHVTWSASLDRFSFIAIDLALRVLIVHPEFWNKTQSDGDSILFKANDFADPAQSSIFSLLLNKPLFVDDAKNFSTICRSAFDKTPTLEDFLARRNIPQASIRISSSTHTAPVRYLAAFPVLDATNYDSCFLHIGDKIELIGQIVEVKQGTTKQGKTYVFINFGHWQGNIVKINIWPKRLNAMTNKPDQSWVGQWITVIGLMEPPRYISRRKDIFHLSITLEKNNQFRLITEKEAKFRLAGSATRGSGIITKSRSHELQTYATLSAVATPTSRNQKVLQLMNAIPSVTIMNNKTVLQTMHAGKPAPVKNSHGTTSHQNNRKTTSSSFIGNRKLLLQLIFWIIAVSLISVIFYMQGRGL
ncbi:hypothetical protein B488_06720 [Liberibacter crescens BT-1]|uniref:Serine/threonine protein kinase n=1 Tax=Liberibacter crescens (strain BT-1) TaxID=1215343 RepID=L0ET08_LIBCB|nr:hypothetical protein [Liberibacter crescens]AGA64664.1 hypothetical protein B488_06720 [Liberibacter crescens BT-1]